MNFILKFLKKSFFRLTHIGLCDILFVYTKKYKTEIVILEVGTVMPARLILSETTADYTQGFVALAR